MEKEKNEEKRAERLENESEETGRYVIWTRFFLIK